MDGDVDDVEGFGDSPRVRLFPDSHLGPYTVFVRKLARALNPLRFTVQVNKKYKSVVSSEHIHNKMKFVLSKREDANDLILDPIFAEFRVFIPAAEIEVEAVINFSDLCDIDNIDSLKSDAKGIFDNTDRSAVSIVDVYRFTSKSASGPDILSNAIKITFEGRIVPSHIVYYGLRVKVRPWFQRAMFCDRCQHFQHTSKFCNRKAKCAKCFGDHLTSTCESNEVNHSLCPYCQTLHENGKHNCPHFKKVNNDFFRAQRSKYESLVCSIPIPHQLHTTTQSVSDTNSPADPSLPESSKTQIKTPINIDPVETSNAFGVLQQHTEEVNTVPLIKPPKRPRKLPFANPWSGRQSDQPKSAAKRKFHTSPLSTPLMSTLFHPTEPKPDTSAPSTVPPGFQRTTNLSAAFVTDIITNIGVAIGLSQHWLSVLRSLAPLVIAAVQSFMSYSPSAPAATVPPAAKV